MQRKNVSTEARVLTLESILELEDAFSPLIGARHREFLRREPVRDEELCFYHSETTSKFVGRTQELAYLHSWVNENSRPLMLLSGCAGVGKTTLLRRFSESADSVTVLWFRSNAFKYVEPNVAQPKDLLSALIDVADFEINRNHTLEIQLQVRSSHFLAQQRTKNALVFVWDPTNWEYFSKPTVIDRFAEIMVSLSRVLQDTLKVIIATEDESFLEHKDLNLKKTLFRLNPFRKDEARDFVYSYIPNAELLEQNGFLTKLLAATCGHPWILNSAVSNFAHWNGDASGGRVFISEALSGLARDVASVCHVPPDWYLNSTMDDKRLVRCLVHRAPAQSVKFQTLAKTLDFESSKAKKRLWKTLENWEQQWGFIEIDSSHEVVSFRNDLTLPALRTAIFCAELREEFRTV